MQYAHQENGNFKNVKCIMNKNVRLNLTENERIAQNVVGLNTNANHFAMSNNINDVIQREKQNKFNDQVDNYVNKLNEHVKSFEQATEQLGYDVTKLEIKPMFNRILITLFDKNPFQRITIENGIITDLGGLNPQYKNTDTGEIEEMEKQIIVGVVQEVGPDCKYVSVGDTIFLDKASARPVPFFKQGFYCISEQQIIAIVNENLEDRFNEIKFNEKQNN